MEYEKKADPQSNLYPTAPTGDPYLPPYAAFQSPTPGGVAYPQAPPQPPLYPQPHGQPQQMVVVMPQTVIVGQPSSVSMVGAIVLSCCSFWCCGSLGGLIGFILAMVGQSKARDGKMQSAIQLRMASYVASIVGIVLGIIITLTVLCVVVPKIFMGFADRPT